jgi:PIN domain nuclease of toxin-antitoxin system
MREIFVLDACALVALLKNEYGAEKVAAVYTKANNGEAGLIINRVNLFEVYYGFYRDRNKDYAENIVNNVSHSSISIREFDNEIFTEAGRLKAFYKISLADSVALAQTIVSSGTLLTADHHEFDTIEKCESIRFEWIR